MTVCEWIQDRSKRTPRWVKIEDETGYILHDGSYHKLMHAGRIAPWTRTWSIKFKYVTARHEGDVVKLIVY